MRKLTLISPVNTRPLKHVYVSWILCSETNEAISRLQCWWGNDPFSNQLIPLPINNDTAVSDRNGMLVSESEVSGMLGVACKERVVCFQIRRKKRHKSPFLSTKKIGKKLTAGFSICIYSTSNHNHPTPLRTDIFQLTGNTFFTAVIW